MRLVAIILFLCTISTPSYAIDPRVEIGRNLHVLFMCKGKGTDYMLAPVCDAVQWLMSFLDPKSWDSLDQLYMSPDLTKKTEALTRCSGLFHMVAQQAATARCKGLLASSGAAGISFAKLAIDMEWAAAAHHAKAQNMTPDPALIIKLLQTDIADMINANTDAYADRLIYEYSVDGTILGSDKFMESEMGRCRRMAADWTNYPAKEFGINIKIK